MLNIILVSNNLPGGYVNLEGIKPDLSNVKEVLIAMKLLPAPAPKKPLRRGELKLKQIGLNFNGDDCIYI